MQPRAALASRAKADRIGCRPCAHLDVGRPELLDDGAQPGGALGHVGLPAAQAPVRQHRGEEVRQPRHDQRLTLQDLQGARRRVRFQLGS